MELLEGQTDRARRHQQLLTRLNSLFAFAAKSCTEERIPGRGVPITKVRGSYAHTVASVREDEGRTPRFGSLYALDSMEEATQFRLENERLSRGIDKDLIEELGGMFTEFNHYAREFKHMKDVIEA
jgi:type II secretory pathway component PulJ